MTTFFIRPISDIHARRLQVRSGKYVRIIDSDMIYEPGNADMRKTKKPDEGRR